MIVALLTWPAVALAADLLSVFEWDRPEDYFGGVSAIEVTEDGTGFLAVADSAQVMRGRIERDAEGRITGMALDGPIGGLAGPDGVPLWRRGDRSLMDSEGVAVLPDGRFAVSFEGEGTARVWLYDPAATDGGPAEPLPDHPDFPRLQTNSALEALAADAQGRLWAIPERSGALDRPFPVYRYADGAWTVPLSLPRRGRFLPVGADFDDRGRLYLLERDFRGLLGFQSRVRRFTFDGDAIAEEETLLSTLPRQRDNLEGIAVWRDAGGALRMTMVSDDNNSFLQTTEVVEYRLTD